MNCIYSSTTYSIATFALMILMLSPAQSAPASTTQDLQRRQTGQAPSSVSLEAFNGIRVTAVYNMLSPGFSSGNGGSVRVADSMCDLLAYRDLLEAQISDKSNETELNEIGSSTGAPPTTTTSVITDTTLENLIALIGLNVEDACAWLRVMAHQEGSTQVMSPTSCDSDYLRLYCLSHRLTAMELSLSQAIKTSIYNTYNGGSEMAIPVRSCDWIDRKVPELKPYLDHTFGC